MGTHLDRKSVAELTLPQGKRSHFYWDDALIGFGLKLHLDAADKLRRSFVVQYRHGGFQRRRKLGNCPPLNADAARKKALAMLGKVAEGIDPAGERQDAVKITLRSAIDQYIQMKEAEVSEGNYRASSLKVTRLYLTGAQYFGPLHKLGINAVTKKDVAARLNAIRLETSDTTAGRARAQLSAFYVRMMQDGIAEANPTIGTRPQQEKPKRDRVLSNDELAAIWNACGDDDFGRIVRLLILTGCRRSEIGGLRWSWLDPDSTAVTIPATFAKNGREHTLPLTEMARKIIASVPEMVGRDFLFGERSEVGFRSWSQSKAALGDGCKEWTVHDIRRSVATGMADLGIQPHVIECVLNHTGHRSGTQGVYNRGSYAREMRNALSIWADHIRSIVTGSERKVLPMRVS